MNGKYLIKLCYVGTAYSGYQVQNNAVTVQGTLNTCFASLFGQGCRITGCSRTDSGVHANCFYITLEIPEGSDFIPCEGLPFAANKLLPPDISVLECSVVPSEFHPRYDVKYKEYKYIIYRGRQRNPFYENRAFHFPKPLDIEKMKTAAEYVVGKHDFKAFMAQGSDVENTVRNVKYVEISEENDTIEIKIAADGFLYNMVRIIVGTLLCVGEGRFEPEDMKAIIASLDRANAGFTAPAHGLYLNRVVY